MGMSKKGLLFTIVIIWLFTCGNSYASDLLDVSINSGFSGKCKLNGINPVKITVESREKDIAGELIIKFGGKNYHHPVELPQGTKKTYSFPLPAIEMKQEIEVSFLSEGKVIASQNILPEVLPADSVFIGILSENPAQLSYVKEMNLLLLDGKEKVVFPLDEDIPYSVSEMNNLNFIIVDDFNTNSLSRSSQELLENWVLQGGTILVGTGQYGYKTLTGIFDSIEGINRIGNGCIIAFSHELGARDNLSIVENSIMQNITSKGLERLINGTNYHNRAEAGEQLQLVGDSLIKPKQQTIWFLIALLLLYLIFLSVSILRYKIWYFFPACILAFSIIFYVLAWSGGLYQCKAAAAGINIYQNNNTNCSLINIYPYKNGQTQINFPNAFYTTEVGREVANIDPLEHCITYDFGEAHYCFNQIMSKGIDASLKLNFDGEILRGEIINPLVSDLNNSFIIMGDTVINLGDLSGKKKVQLQYSLDHRLRNLADYNYLAEIYQNVDLNSYQRELFDYYFKYLAHKEINCFMCGFSTDGRELSINGRPGEIKQLNLNVFPIQIEFTSHEVVMPPDYIQPIVDFPDNLDSEKKREYILKEGEELIAYYVIPPEMKSREISLITKVEGGVIDIEVYNWQQKNWEELKVGMLQGNNLVKFAGSRPLAVKVKGDGRVIIPQVIIKGENFGR